MNESYKEYVDSRIGYRGEMNIDDACDIIYPNQIMPDESKKPEPPPAPPTISDKAVKILSGCSVPITIGPRGLSETIEYIAFLEKNAATLNEIEQLVKESNFTNGNMIGRIKRILKKNNAAT